MRSTAEWKYWGKSDPLWAVMTDRGRERDGENPWTKDEFLSHGRKDLSCILRHWDHYGRSPSGVCVEIGCGSGRITTALVKVFERVFAVDVSADQVAKATEFLGGDSERVQFDIVESAVIRLPDSTCSGIFSSHVFQHLPNFGHIETYIREAYRVLQPGGTTCLHIPVPGDNRPERPRWRDLAQTVRLEAMRRLGNLAVMEYHDYPVSKVLSSLREAGFVDNELRIFPMPPNGVPQAHFFSRKPL